MRERKMVTFVIIEGDRMKTGREHSPLPIISGGGGCLTVNLQMSIYAHFFFTVMHRSSSKTVCTPYWL